MAAIPGFGEDFSPTPLWNENADLNFSLNNEGEDVNKKTPEQREHRLAQRRQRLEIRFIPWKTQIVSLPVKFPADRSKFQF